MVLGHVLVLRHFREHSPWYLADIYPIHHRPYKSSFFQRPVRHTVLNAIRKSTNVQPFSKSRLVLRDNFKFILQKDQSIINYRCKKLPKATYESNSPVIIKIIYFTLPLFLYTGLNTSQPTFRDYPSIKNNKVQYIYI